MGTRIKTLSEIGERQLIDRIRRSEGKHRGVLCGIGDDTAVLAAAGRKRHTLVTTDMIVENVHFTIGMGAERIGYKALSVNISDIAAMGGVPTYALISLGTRSSTSMKCINGILRGIRKAAREFNVGIIGGDTVRSDRLVISVTLLGEVRPKDVVLRSTAKPGDVICTTGALGHSLRTAKHLTFTPRVKEAQFLVRTAKPSAMMDISDGLVSDLGQIIRESRVGALLYEDQIPITRGAALHNALYDGEDFELLFTLSRSKAAVLKKKKLRSLSVYTIGEITAEKNIVKCIQSNGKKYTLQNKGFRHF